MSIEQGSTIKLILNVLLPKILDIIINAQKQPTKIANIFVFVIFSNIYILQII